jgi:hypothetical protein
MIFLIEYNKKTGEVVTLRQFQDSEQSLAQKERLTTELDLNRRGMKHEVVLLEAADYDALLKTHNRYFSTLRELTTPSGRAGSEPPPSSSGAD